MSDAKSGTKANMIAELERLIHEVELVVAQKTIDEYFDHQHRKDLVKQMQVSPLFASLVSEITSDIMNGVEIIPSGQIPTPRDMSNAFLPPDNSEFMISMSTGEFIKMIATTYKTDKAVIDQFLRDFDRQIIKINGQTYRNIDDLFMELSASNRKTKIANGDGKELSSMMALLLITCQSTHFVSYMFAHESVSDVREKAIMTSDASSTRHSVEKVVVRSNDVDCEARKVDAFVDPRVNYYVMNGEGFNTIDIVIDNITLEPTIGCVIETTYKILDTSTTKKVYDIATQTIYSENADRCLIKYTVTKCK